jgi:cellulose biosynthesis protein BcsQ
MSLVVVAGAKGAAGVTTTATVLAAVWPATALLADCDPTGGDVALRLRDEHGGWLAGDRGVVGLAAAARMRSGRLDLDEQVQTAVGGLPVLVGVDSPAQGSRIGGLWPAIAATLAQAPTMDVVADCGRLLPGLPSEHLIAAADLLVLVVRPTAESVAHARHALDALETADALRARRLHVAVVGDPATLGRDVEQVRDALSAVVPDGAEFGGLAQDAQAAAGLAGTPTRKLDRSALVTSARRLAHELYERVHRAPAETNGPALTADAPQLDAAPVEVG